MTAAASLAARSPAHVLRDEEVIVRKVFRRLIPLLFVLYVFAYLDRINIGFAALSMNEELGSTATMFGVANTIFYLGYWCVKSRATCSWSVSAPGAGFPGS
jgi:sugar phosphate permease